MSDIPEEKNLIHVLRTEGVIDNFPSMPNIQLGAVALWSINYLYLFPQKKIKIICMDLYLNKNLLNIKENLIFIISDVMKIFLHMMPKLFKLSL